MVSSLPEPLILIVDGWLANAGDAAINLATARSLRREIPTARVVLASHHRALVGDRYPELDLAPPIDALAGVSWPWTTAEDVAERDTIDLLVEEADLVLAAGGGYMLERYHPEGRIRGYEYLLERGKRFIAYSQSIGRFQDPDLRNRLGAVLKAAELVLVRDEQSLEIVREQRPDQDLHLTADEAFLFPVARRVPPPRSLLVTVSVHPWERDNPEDELHGDSHLREIAGSLSRLLASGAARSVTLASTTQGLAGADVALEDDAIASRTVFESIPTDRRNRVRVRDGYLTAGEYAALAKRHTAVVSMRMHGAILGATAGTPVLLANASDKASGLSQRTDGGIQTIGGRVDLNRIDDFLAPLLEDPRSARVRQNGAVEQMRSLARHNAELVAELL
jgi:polysaccharide pyruvyl transferase WcaK-like protein